MTSTFATLSLFFALAAAGCTKAGSNVDDGTGARPGPPQPQPAQNDVMVELSAVTLGDDCGTPPPPPAKPPQNAKPARAAAPSSMVAPSEAPADCAEGQNCGGGRYNNCHQTSIQLAMEGRGTGAPVQVRVKKVELLDAKGTFISELTASKPGKWSDASATYEPWDQNVAMGELPAVSYVLTAPKWWEMQGGHYAQTGKTFQVRVTLTVGAKDKVVEKQAIQPAIRPPAVPT